MAKKKDTKKISKKALAPTAHQVPVYELAGKEFPAIAGQGALIKAALEKRGTATAAEITSDIDGRLQTKQEPHRVVTYYMLMWKSKGLVKAGKAPSEKQIA